MNCQDTQKYLHAYADGELDLANSLALEEHLHQCQRCTQQWTNQQTLRAELSHPSLYFKAPSALRQRLLTATRQPEQPKRSVRLWSWNWLNVSLPIAAVLVAMAFLLPPILIRTSSQEHLADQVVTSHVRSLMPNHLVDVPSTDQHTVKPWFAGKLDFSPVVKDLSAEGFALVGGRLDYVEHRPVASVVYQRRQHLINLFIWPASGAPSVPAPAEQRQGYNLVRWSAKGMAFWAVSDLNGKELLEFAKAVAKE